MPDRPLVDPSRFQAELMRYSEFDRKIIEAYFVIISSTRKTGKLADGIIQGELDYWSKYPADIVIQSLRTHIRKYAGLKENYTRGIIRNANAQVRAKEGGLPNEVPGEHAGIGERGHYGQGEDKGRYIGTNDPLPI